MLTPEGPFWYAYCGLCGMHKMSADKKEVQEFCDWHNKEEAHVARSFTSNVREGYGDRTV